ncbi:MAG: hypothetical protein KC731_31830 [Myxococcales bacterium]|nr:hypothetical protein [Myxococcales bacterium]
MTRLTSLFIALAALLFVSSTASASPGDVSDALAHVPSDSFAVLTADLDSVKTTAIFDKIKQTFLKEEKDAKKELAELKKATGFDPWRDVHAAVLAFPPEFLKNDDNFVAVIRADVDEAKVLAYMKSKGGKVEQKQSKSGGNYYLLGDRKKGAMAFRGKLVFVAGAQVIERALASRTAPAPLRRVLGKFEKSDIGLAIRAIPELTKKLKKEDPMLADAKDLAAGLDLAAGGLALEAVASFSNTSTPKKIADLANDGLKKGQADKSVKEMGFDTLLGKIKVEARGTKLEGNASLTKSEVDRVMKTLEKLLF